MATQNDAVQVRTWLSRTAVWVGDRVEFVVELTCAPNVDVLAEDLAQDKLELDGLDALAAATERVTTEGGGVTHRIRYQLTTYDTTAPSLKIGALKVRYYVRRPGERPEDARPAGDVQVPGAVIARRSTLPDALPGLDLRDRGALHTLPAALRVARAVGVGLIALAAFPLAVWGGALIRRSRSRVRAPSARVVRSHGRAALDELRALDTTTEGGRLEAYGRLDRALRQHLAESRGMPAHALSAGEISARLEASGSAGTAGHLLSECEHARYAPPDRLPSSDRFAAALAAAEQILEGRAS